MPFLVLVAAHPDEAKRTTPDQIDAAEAWLEAKEAEGTIRVTLPYDKPYAPTGGFMLVDLESRAALDLFLADYPLLGTIDLDIRKVRKALRPGFDHLRADQAEHARQLADA